MRRFAAGLAARTPPRAQLRTAASRRSESLPAVRGARCVAEPRPVIALPSSRAFASAAKDRGGSGGKKGGRGGDSRGAAGTSGEAGAAATPSVDPTEALQAGKDRMRESLERLESKLAQLRVGGADADMLDDLAVATGGKRVPLSELASVAAPSAKQLVVTVHDAGAVGDVSKAIASAPHMNLVPQVKGTVIEVGIPKTTKEQRDAKVKQASELAEAAKQGIRGARKEAHARLHKGGLSEDELKRADKQLQTMTDAANEKASAVFERKKLELLKP